MAKYKIVVFSQKRIAVLKVERVSATPSSHSQSHTGSIWELHTRIKGFFMAGMK